jgi:hypothetical protein
MSDPYDRAVQSEYIRYLCLYSDGNLNALRDLVHEQSINWWKDPATGEPIDRNVGELLMLAVSELSEAMEGHRKNLMDDKLSSHKMFEVEIADCLIRLLDMAGGLGINIGSIVAQKIIYNMYREDHKIEQRLAPNGKRY